MAEVYPVDEVLEKVKDFPPIQRILLSTAGTLQSMLSAYFVKAVKIQVNSQSEPLLHKPDSDQGMSINMSTSILLSLTRNVDLFIHKGEGEQKHPLVVCSASSEVTVSNQTVINLLQEKELGLGQIMESLGIRPKFTLQEVGCDAVSFWRLYTLSGDGINYKIRETFPMNLYQ